MTEKKILVMVHVQSIFIESQAVGFRVQALVMKSFYRKAVGLRLYNIDVCGGVLSQIGS